MDKETLDRKTTPPKWCKNAVLDVGGWKDPNTDEVLVGRRVTQEEIDHYMQKQSEPVRKKQKHTKKTIETPDEIQSTTTETQTPDERDGRSLLEETHNDDYSEEREE